MTGQQVVYGVEDNVHTLVGGDLDSEEKTRELGGHDGL